MLLDQASASFPPSGHRYPLAISRLFGGQRSFTFHFSNAATPSSPNAVNLILASDAGDPNNDIILHDLDNQTVSIFGSHTGYGLEIFRISTVHRRIGTGSSHILTAACSLHLKPGPGVTCLDPAFYREIARLPNSRAQMAVNSQRIEHWDKYLEINEGIARSAEATVRYARLRAQPGSLQCVFTLAGDAITEKQVGSSIQLITGETDEDGQTAYQGPQAGSIRAYDAHSHELTADLDADFQALWSDGRFSVPPSGRLFISKLGDLVQLRRLRNGLKAFARGQAANHQLDTFMFDAARARLPEEPLIRLAPADLLQPDLNPEQRQAVEGVLNSPDLFLIQGPPGTGKTTVIAEICYQNAMRGQRTLIASQTNLAVDNALGKLVHHPGIRALRKGNESSVQAEGLPFTESRVIGTWLCRTADASVKQLAGLASSAAQIESARRQLPDIAWTHRSQRRLQRWLDSNEPAIHALQRRNAALDAQYRLLDDTFDRFMSDPRGPAFTVLSANAALFGTQDLVLIGRINMAAARYHQEKLRTDAETSRFNALCRELERLAAGTRRRLERVSRRRPAGPVRSHAPAGPGRSGSVPDTASGSARPPAVPVIPQAGSVALLQESGFEFTLADYIGQAERLKRELVRINRTAPGFFRILFGLTGGWPDMAADRLALARFITASRDRILRTELAAAESVFDNPDVANAFRSLAGTFSSIREALRMNMNENLNEIDSLLEQIARCRQLLQDGRRRIEAYHASLPGDAIPGPIDSFAALAAAGHAATGDAAARDAVSAAGDAATGDADPLDAVIDAMTDPELDAAIADRYEQAFTQAQERLAARQALVTQWAERIRRPDAQDSAALRQLYSDNANVIGITCNQSGSRDFSQQYPEFDVAIIDEVSKATPPELILSVLKARKIVLVGDHKQLPPMVGMETYEEIARQLEIPEEETAHMKTSLFEELFTRAPQPLRLMLTTQYRMHPQIMESINQFYADGSARGLDCGIADPDTARRHNCHGRALAPGDHALWVDQPRDEAHRERRAEKGFSYANPGEAAAIRRILRTLSANLKANDPTAVKLVGVISFYASQVRLLESELLSPAFAAETPNLTLRVGSVDRFQGIECPVVVCSFVRNNDRGDIGFARDPRRINVALSRARELSVIVGCSALFCGGAAEADSGGTAGPGCSGGAGYGGPGPADAGASGAAAIYRTIAERIRAHGGFRNDLDFV